MTAVRSSGVSTLVTPATMYDAPPSTAMRRSNATWTAALVNGVPSWNVTPSCRWNVNSVLSGLASQLVASRGAIPMASPSILYWTRPSYVLRMSAWPLLA